MGLLQSAILKKYLKATDNKISAAYKQYTSYFHNLDIQENIHNSKEEQYQEGFLRELFVNKWRPTNVWFKNNPKR